LAAGEFEKEKCFLNARDYSTLLTNNSSLGLLLGVYQSIGGDISITNVLGQERSDCILHN
jgi:hypothetical protein